MDPGGQPNVDVEVEVESELEGVVVAVVLLVVAGQALGDASDRVGNAPDGILCRGDSAVSDVAYLADGVADVIEFAHSGKAATESALLLLLLASATTTVLAGGWGSVLTAGR
jgi:hypothetical protein